MKYDDFVEVRSEFESHAATLTSAWQETRKPVKAKFPRGYTRKYADIRPRWPYLDDAHKTLLCQMIQLCDVNRWNLHVWDLAGTAGGAFVWHATVPVIAVIEVLCREFVAAKGFTLRSKRKIFENYIWALLDNQVIAEQLCDRLHELRKYRNFLHLNANQTPQIRSIRTCLPKGLVKRNAQ